MQLKSWKKSLKTFMFPARFMICETIIVSAIFAQWLSVTCRHHYLVISFILSYIHLSYLPPSPSLPPPHHATPYLPLIISPPCLPLFLPSPLIDPVITGRSLPQTRSECLTLKVHPYFLHNDHL